MDRSVLRRHNLENMLCSIAAFSCMSLEPSCFPPLCHLLMHPGETRVRRSNRLSLKPLAASLLGHAVALPFLVFWSVPSPVSVAREEIVEVEIVTLPRVRSERTNGALPSSGRSKLGNPVPQVMPEPKVSVPTDGPTAGDAPTRVKPQHMLSEGVLADPRSKDVRKTLSTLAVAEQVEQLCNLEAMAQVGQWNRSLQPDRVVAYATSATKLYGNSFSAEGAALHSRKDWYSLQFTCDLAPDRKTVVAFEFVVGDVIPRDDWLKNGLPDEAGSFD